MSFLFPANGFDLPLSAIATLAPIQKLDWAVAADSGVEVYVKREDKLHPAWGGNKFYKSYYHLAQLNQLSHLKQRNVVSFGGPYSNHLLALAAMAEPLNYRFTAIVRGEQPTQLSPTLQDLNRLGARVVFVSRSTYRQGMTPDLRRGLEAELGRFLSVPEGGAGLLGAQGCYEWVRACLDVLPSATTLCLALGTGGTCAGVVAASGGRPVHAFMALKGQLKEVTELQSGILSQARTVQQSNSLKQVSDSSLCLETNYHCGGYAKFPPYLLQFKEAFELETGVPLDRVYTAKCFWGIAQKCLANQWPKHSKILVLHTGGLQGNR